MSDWGVHQEERSSHWTTLFYDLLMVAAIGSLSEPFTEEEGDRPPGDHQILPHIPGLLLDAVIKFGILFWVWEWYNHYSARLDDASLAGHLIFFIHAFGMACTAAGCVGGLDQNYKTLLTGVAIAMIGMSLLLVRPILYIPRARYHCIVEIVLYLTTAFAAQMIIYFQLHGVNLRTAMAGIVIMQALSILPMSIVLGKHRLPVHIAYADDRIKEGLMVVFGEAIMALSVRRREPDTQHFYYALFLSLWLIFSLALHQYHISPTPDEHALRRSVVAGVAYLYTSGILMVVLWMTGVGIKRIHFLVGHGVQSVDPDTEFLLIAGITGSLASILSMRFYSFGFGRHPSPYDSLQVKVIKYFWWLFMLAMCTAPYTLSQTLLSKDPSAFTFLGCLGLAMALIVGSEAVLSNLVLMYTFGCSEDGSGTKYLPIAGIPQE